MNEQKPAYSYANIRISSTTSTLLKDLYISINDKAHGRRVTNEVIINYALTRLTEDDLLALKQQSYSNKDKLDLAYEAYLNAGNSATRDEFLGLLLEGKVNNQFKEERS